MQFKKIIFIDYSTPERTQIYVPTWRERIKDRYITLVRKCFLLRLRHVFHAYDDTDCLSENSLAFEINNFTSTPCPGVTERKNTWQNSPTKLTFYGSGHETFGSLAII